MIYFLKHFGISRIPDNLDMWHLLLKKVLARKCEPLNSSDFWLELKTGLENSTKLES